MKVGALAASGLLLVEAFAPRAAWALGQSRAPGFVPEHPTLPHVMREDWSGLAAEKPEMLVALKAEAQQYLDYLNGELTRVQEKELSRDCAAPGATNPYCDAMFGEEKGAARSGKKKESRWAKKRRIRGIGRSLRKADLPALWTASESDLLSALKDVGKIAAIRPLLDKVAESKDPKDCEPSALLVSLGLRIEREFPADEYRKMAVQLYDKAVRCGDDVSAVEAAFRLGLLQVWAGDWAAAIDAFGRILDSPLGTDYRLRAAYWRMYAAGKAGDDGMRDDMRDLVVHEYPLSLHGLFVSSDDVFGDLSILSAREPEVRFRSQSKPGLNARVRAVEMLQTLEGGKLASASMLDDLLDDAQGTETSFRLYLAALTARAGGAASARFQFMTQLVRDAPSILSRSTLKLLYPDETIDIIKSTMKLDPKSTPVDPWLVLSLIRQESAFNHNARSPTGALGLMQLEPGTARRLARVSRRQLYDPATNVRIGVKYFQKLLARYDGDTELALAGYNAGPERVVDWKRRYPVSNRLLFIDLFPLRETRDYVTSIARNYYWYLRLYAQDDLEHIGDAKGLALFRALKEQEQ